MGIRRVAGGRVVAVGGDDAAPFMVKATDFAQAEDGSADTFVLVEGLETYEENEAATKAAVLLATAGYDVTLDPSQGQRPSPPPFVPTAAGRMSPAGQLVLGGRGHAARARSRAATAPESSRPVPEPAADTYRPAPPRSAPSR